MLDLDEVTRSRLDCLQRLNDEIFDFMVVKPPVDTWIEENVYLSESTTVRPGFYTFDFTPYMREIVRHLHPKDPVRFVSIMKDGQSGFTTALVVGGILYIMENTPDGILFTASDITLAKKTIEERFDPVVRSSRKEHLIRPNVVKKTNNRTGDTSLKKEFAGGTMTAAGTNSANTFRMFSARFILSDDYDTAPKEIGKEGSPKTVMKTRQTSFGDKAKTFFISTPTVTQTSNIWEQYQLGTQKKWNWACPACEVYFAVDWKHEKEEQRIGGIVWELDENKRLKLDSVYYKCPHCGHLIPEKMKYDLNLMGKWVATVENPEERRHESYQKNAIYNPPGFDGWVTLVEEWLAANPPGSQKSNVLLLKTFNNLRLGLPFAELGAAPKVNELMKNTRSYKPGTIPDITCDKDSNGKIVLITIAADINGMMNTEVEDVRLDWEVLGHSSTGATYSIDHGSIGTFKRAHEWSKLDKATDKDKEREKWTLTHNVKNSVWKVFKEEVMLREWDLESAERPGEIKPAFDNDGKIRLTRTAELTVIDTGHGAKHIFQFIEEMQAEGYFCFGVKGREEEKFRKLTRDSNPVKRSTERPRHMYIVEVDQMKDDLNQYMRMRAGEDGSQPTGFMNYPQPRDNKYTYNSYFIEYEGERRTEELKNGEVIGYKWVKKNSTVRNHYWDVRVYNLAATYIFLDLIKQADPSKYKTITWEDFVLLLGN